MRAFPALLLLLWAACRLDPAGTCEARADCSAGLDCLGGVCALCRGDADCAGWEACGLDGLCAAVAGRCNADADCQTWEACDGDHACALRADHCDVDADCAAQPMTACDPIHHCALPDGRCLADADCAAWLAGCDTAAGANQYHCNLPTTAGADVLAVGTLLEGSCGFGAVARATTAAARDGLELGLGCGFDPAGGAVMDPVTGGLLYRNVAAAGGQTLRRLRPEALGWDATAGRWRFADEPSANDDVALLPGACPNTWGLWAVQAGTGRLLYGCPVGGAPLQQDVYDEADARILVAVQAVLAWNDGGYLLVVAGDGRLQVVDASGVAANVTGLPAGARLAHRATATGFRVALRVEATGLDELWEISELTSGATLEGTHAALVSGWAGFAGSALDEAGALYGTAFNGLSQAILKRPLAPGATSVVYSEAGAPAGANDFTAATFTGYLKLDDRSRLATRP